MGADVFFCDIGTNHFKTIFDNIARLLSASKFESIFSKNDHVAVKLSFGEWGNLNYVKPQYVAVCVDELKKTGSKPFLTDTNTLYKGMRTEAVGHIANAVRNGFGYDGMQVPVIIADGIKGNNYIEVDVPGKPFSKVKIASDIYNSDAILCISHFKFHELVGFGGAIKNLGMGCAAKAGKIEMHSDIKPNINQRCLGCGKCAKLCKTHAISIDTNRYQINKEKCTGCGNCLLACTNGAIKTNWDTNGEAFQRKLVQYAFGAVKNKTGKCLYINFLTNITPVCDCVNYTPEPLMRDIGIIASTDPVACDMASVDIVNSEYFKNICTAEDKQDEGYINKLYPGVPWMEQLNYAEELGMGTKNYKINRLYNSKQQNRANVLSKISKKISSINVSE